MKAIIFKQHGGPEVLEYVEWPEPKAAPGEVIVTIHAASVNGADCKVRRGKRAQMDLPFILGRDFSGVVEKLGEGVTDIAVGDRVFGVIARGFEGGYADKIAIDSGLVCKMPDSWTFVEGAAIALTGLTSLISLEDDTLKLQKGERIFIQGGSGGVAGFAIQLARHLGAYVITTTSTKNLDYVRGLGADEVIDYTKEDFTKVVSNVDAAFDTVGGDVALRTFEVVRSGGRAAFIGSGLGKLESPRDDVTSLRPLAVRHRKYLERIVDLVETGAVSMPEIKVFPFSEVVEAHRVSETRRVRGKLVLQAIPD